MRKSYLSFITALVFTAIFFAKCADNKQADPTTESTAAAEKANFGGYETQVKWGEHLVTIGGTGCR